MLRSPRNAWFAVLAFALVAGYFVIGPLLSRIPIGLDASAFPAGEALQRIHARLDPSIENASAGLIWLLLLLLVVAALGFFVVRSAVRARGVATDPERRRFLAGAGAGVGAAVSSLVVAGGTAASRSFFGVGTGTDGWSGVATHINDGDVAFTHPEWKDEWRGSRIQGHRRFGRTEWQISDIVLGTGRIEGERGVEIARAAIERGVNYFDTSPDYSAAGSEAAMGQVLKAGGRDRLFIATKFCTPIGHLPPGTPVQRYKEIIHDSLRRLGTDYVDLVHVHSCDEVERLLDPNMHEAFVQLKREGKARFLGFSSHTPNLVEVANTAIDDGRFDVMMLAYHHGLWAPLGDIIRRARTEQDMGVVAMKTLKGAKHRGLTNFHEHADSYTQAALKWVLSNPDVSCAVISFFELQHVDEYLAASGKSFTAADRTTLDAYESRIAGTYCGPHCGQCLSSCPEELPIHDVLRHRMYFEDYGWEKQALQRYAGLERNASACLSCSAPCRGSCPVGLDIQERMVGAHELLTLG
ncbi:MAG: aldo/keto reductase [Deltaproteobacteria bacterium]|nr:aldo/keto reductase [Deltaproteobacteria bacterium]MBW2359517.1 aldo/keto reductase [Deltaproteobacteria bacterium]